MKSPNHIMEILERQNLTAGLYLGATPIGNLGDITLRVLHALLYANEIWAEDTRNIRKLMQLYDIPLGDRPLVACHDHNEAQLAARCVAAIEAGSSVLYVSDAGMPIVSDPGYRLVSTAHDHQLSVHILPGASAVLTALAGAGAPSDQFAFYGFAPNKAGALETFMENLRAKSQTAILFESPRRLLANLQIIASIFGDDHKICVARELTKTFEENLRGSVRNVILHYENHPPKGEIVIVIWPAEHAAFSEDDVVNLLRKSLAERKMNDAVKEVAKVTGFARNKVYELALSLKN